MEFVRQIHPRPRLSAAIDMLRGSSVVADIGCDHGRLSCALIQQGAAKRCIAVDISAPSLEKARRLADFVGVGDHVETRLGDGFASLAPGEADAIALLGMGGALMVRLLERCGQPLNGATRAVFQPMRAVDDIRRYLFYNGYPILADRVVEEGGRLYQVFCAGEPDGRPVSTPAGWPKDCFCLGYTAFARRDPLIRTLAGRMLARHEKRLAKGDAPALAREAEQLRRIVDSWAQG